MKKKRGGRQLTGGTIDLLFEVSVFCLNDVFSTQTKKGGNKFFENETAK